MPAFSLLTAAERVRNAQSLPTRQQGSILPPLRPGPMTPGWSVWEAQSRTVTVDALRWPRSRDTYEDMSRDPQIQGLLMSVALPIRHMEWYVDPAGTKGTVAREIAEDFGLPVLGDEEIDEDGDGIDFDEHLRLALLALAHGHQFFEESGIIQGRGPGAKFRLRHLAERPKETLEMINVTANGDLISIRVPAAEPDTDGPWVDLPAEHLLSYCWDRRGADWSGRPLLYGLYRAWLLKDELIREDAMMTRRFGGIPVVEATERDIGENALADAAVMAQSVQSGDGAGVALPYGTRLRILGVEGSLPKPLESVRYHDQQMARAFMQMVLELGQTPNGSRALGETLMDHYALGVLSIAKWVQKTQMRLVRRIVKRNYGASAPLPHIRYRDNASADLATGDLCALINAGAVTVDDDLEAQIRTRGNLTKRNPAQPAHKAPGGDKPGDGMPAENPAGGGGAATVKRKNDLDALLRRQPPADRSLFGAAGTPNTGVMVALYPSPAIAATLALDGGEAAEALHITLAFLGKAADLADPIALQTAVRVWAATVSGLVGEVSGAGLFTAGDEPVTYLSVDVPALAEARQALIRALTAAGMAPAAEHGFTAHLTVAYADRVSEVNAGGQMLTFDTVAVVIGDQRTDYTFGTGAIAAGSELAAAASGKGWPDYTLLTRDFDRGLERLLAVWHGITLGQIADLSAQVAVARGLEDLALISPIPAGADELAQILIEMLDDGVASAIAEAKAQGLILLSPLLVEPQLRLVGSARATSTMLSRSLGVSAASKATGLWGPDVDNHQLARDVAKHLLSLKGQTATYELAGLATQAQNTGRDAAFALADPDATFYASAMMDDACCAPCKKLDGKQYATLAAARKDFPAGQYVGCKGNKRCRCSLIAVHSTEIRAAGYVEAKHARRKDGKWTTMPDVLGGGTVPPASGVDTTALRDLLADEHPTTPQEYVAIGGLIRDALDDAAGIKTLVDDLAVLTRQAAVTKLTADAQPLVRRLVAAKKALDDARRRELRITLMALRPFGGDFALRGVTPRRQASAVAAVSVFLPTDWINASNNATPALAVREMASSTFRAEYGFRTSTVHVSKGSTNPSLIAHELAHRFEETVPGLKDIEAAFWRARTARGSYTRISSKERGIKDGFTRLYTGKDYDGRWWEILSMGLEGVLYGRYDILDDDPEHADLIIGMLAKAGTA